MSTMLFSPTTNKAAHRKNMKNYLLKTNTNSSNVLGRD